MLPVAATIATLTAGQESVGMTPVWYAASVLSFRGALIAFENDDIFVKISEDPGGEESGDAAADNDGPVSMRT